MGKIAAETERKIRRAPDRSSPGAEGPERHWLDGKKVRDGGETNGVTGRRGTPRRAALVHARPGDRAAAAADQRHHGRRRGAVASRKDAVGRGHVSQLHPARKAGAARHGDTRIGAAIARPGRGGSLKPQGPKTLRRRIRGGGRDFAHGLTKRPERGGGGQSMPRRQRQLRHRRPGDVPCPRFLHSARSSVSFSLFALPQPRPGQCIVQ